MEIHTIKDGTGEIRQEFEEHIFLLTVNITGIVEDNLRNTFSVLSSFQPARFLRFSSSLLARPCFRSV